MTDKAREEFEFAVLRDWPQAPLRRCDAVSSRAGQYADEIVQRAWWGWQASRAALVIELPEGFETYCGSTEERVIYADEMKDVLEAAGLKVAP